MSNPVARRYAQALADEAARQDVLRGVDEDMAMVRESLDGSPELERFFRSPVIGRDKKKAVTRQLFEERVQPLTHRFLQLLVDKERETELAAMAVAYRALRDEQRGIVEVQVRTATSLTTVERERLSARLGRMTGKDVRLNVREDASLMGGLVVRVGDTVYDGSVRHQLETLRERLTQNTTVAANGHAG